jgi:hypothetical protein
MCYIFIRDWARADMLWSILHLPGIDFFFDKGLIAMVNVCIEAHYAEYRYKEQPMIILVILSTLPVHLHHCASGQVRYGIGQVRGLCFTFFGSNVSFSSLN